MSQKNVLILGVTGHLGQHMVQAMQEQGLRVHALIRPESLRSEDPQKQEQVAELVRRGVVLHEGNIEKTETLVPACRAADIVVSCAGGMHIGAQSNLLAAMKLAGNIERFLPSEFGLDPRLLEPGRCLLGDIKSQFQQQVLESGVPHTFAYANGFASYWAAGLGQVGLFAPPEEEITVYGDGSMKSAILAPQDIARYTARVVTDPRTLNRHVSFMPEGNLVSQEDMIQHWEATRGVTLKRSTLGAAQMDGMIDGLTSEPDQMFNLIVMQLVRSAWFEGALNRIFDNTLNAATLYPELRVQTPLEFINGFLPEETAFAAPVQQYIEAINEGNVDKLVNAFDPDYRSDQPKHPQRAFSGRDMVRKNHLQFFGNGQRIALKVNNSTVGRPDKQGVSQHWLEVNYDLLLDDGSVKYNKGIIVFGASQKAIHWGRLYIDPLVQEATSVNIDQIIETSRR